MTLSAAAQRFLGLAATGRPRPAIDLALELRAGRPTDICSSAHRRLLPV